MGELRKAVEKFVKRRRTKKTQGVSFLKAGTKEIPVTKYYSRGNRGPFTVVDIIRDIDGDSAYQLMYHDPDTKLYKHLVIKKEMFNKLFKKG